MASTFRLSNVAAAACAGDGTNKGILPLFSGGKVHLYDGSQVANPDTAVSGNDYCSATPVTLNATNSESNGVITFGAITNGTCSYSGTPTWFRVYASDGTTALCDGSVGVSGCDMNFAGGVSFVSGGTISVSSGSFTVPAH